MIITLDGTGGTGTWNVLTDPQPLEAEVSKNKRRNRAADEPAAEINQAAIEAAAAEPIAEAEPVAKTATDPVANDPIVQGVVEKANEVLSETPAEPVAEAPKTRIRYAVLEGRREFKFRRGFETVLNDELVKNGGGTVEEITQRLLDSGEYQRVAPAAAANRATKPVAFLLRQWTTGKLLVATELTNEEPAAEPVTEEAPAEELAATAAE